jgi:hypothetical protein
MSICSVPVSPSNQRPFQLTKLTLLLSALNLPELIK